MTSITLRYFRLEWVSGKTPDYHCPFLAEIAALVLLKRNAMDSIRRNVALREYDIKETPQGRQVVFSIKFLKKNGESVFLPKAVAAGLKFSMKDNRMRGVVAVDDKGDKIGHIYPVNIDLIMEWNGKQIVL